MPLPPSPLTSVSLYTELTAWPAEMGGAGGLGAGGGGEGERMGGGGGGEEGFGEGGGEEGLGEGGGGERRGDGGGAALGRGEGVGVGLGEGLGEGVVLGVGDLADGLTVMLGGGGERLGGVGDLWPGGRTVQRLWRQHAPLSHLMPQYFSV